MAVVQAAICTATTSNASEWARKHAPSIFFSMRGAAIGATFKLLNDEVNPAKLLWALPCTSEDFINKAMANLGNFCSRIQTYQSKCVCPHVLKLPVHGNLDGYVVRSLKRKAVVL